MDLLVEVIKAVAENIDSDDDDNNTEDDSGGDTDSQNEDTTEDDSDEDDDEDDDDDDDDEDDSEKDDEDEDGFNFGESRKEDEQSKSQTDKGSSEKKRGKPVRGLEMPERVANPSMFMMRREKTDAEEFVEGAIEIMSMVGAIGQQMQGQGGMGGAGAGGHGRGEEAAVEEVGNEVVELPPIPAAGMRLPLDTTSQTPFPDSETIGDPTLRDLDGTPIFLGSALLEKSIQPCKVIVKPGPQIAVSVPYSQAEYPHNGRYDLLLFIPDQMEWVETRQGKIPKKRKPVEGGFEEDGTPLYHGLVNVNGHFVPGKCGEHLNGCVASWQGAPYVFCGHRILCWVKGFMEEQMEAQKELENEKELEKKEKEQAKESEAES